MKGASCNLLAAACHIPRHLCSWVVATSRLTCSASDVSQRSTIVDMSSVCSARHSCLVPGPSVLLCEARTRSDAPRCASQRPVTSPSPAVPPVTTWAAPTVGRAATRTTILPVLSPLCKVRNASSA
eukprot:3509130-Prymnesium_polylepis.1